MTHPADSDHPPTFEQISETLRQALATIDNPTNQDSRALLAELSTGGPERLPREERCTALGLLEAAVSLQFNDPESFAELASHPALSWPRLTGALGVLVALELRPDPATLTLLAACSLCVAGHLSPELSEALNDLVMDLESGDVIEDLTPAQRQLALGVIDRAADHLRRGGQVLGTPDLVAALTPEQLDAARSALQVQLRMSMPA